MFTNMHYAYTVYQEKSFTKAAKKLYITQPALSLTIKKLEKSIGYPLFNRSGREITLTPIGEKYIKAVEEILRIQTNFENELDDMQCLRRGHLTLGSTTFVASYLLPRFLKAFQAAYPFVEIRLLVEQSTVLEKKLEEGLVDFIIDNRSCEKSDYIYRQFLEEQLYLAVPKDFSVNKHLSSFQISQENLKNASKAAALPKIALSSFSEEPFILLKHGNNMRLISDRLFEENGLKPDIRFEFDQLMTAVSYAESGFGCCFLTDTILRYGKGCQNVFLYRPETSHAARTLYIIHKKNIYLPSAARALIEHLCPKET